MVFFKKNIFHHIGLFTTIFIVAVVYFVWIPQPVSAADMTAADCEKLFDGGNCSDSCSPATEISRGTCSRPGFSDGLCCALKAALKNNCSTPPGNENRTCGTCNVSGLTGPDLAPAYDCGASTCCTKITATPPPDPDCSGGKCVLASDPCPKDFPTRSGSCSPAKGGGACCKTTAATTQQITFTNPLKFDTVEQVLGSLLGALQGIIVVLALVFIVIGAILYITSAGNDSRMTLAKGAIAAAMIGLAIGIAAPSFLKEIATILGWNTVDASLTGAKTLSEIALNVLKFLLSIVGILGIIMLVIGGIMYLTAAGDEDRIDTGKKIVTYAIIGIAIALAALVIVTQIASFFAA